MVAYEVTQISTQKKFYVNAPSQDALMRVIQKVKDVAGTQVGNFRIRSIQVDDLRSFKGRVKIHLAK